MFEEFESNAFSSGEFQAGINSNGILTYPMMGQLVTEDAWHLPEFREMDEIFSILGQSRRPNPEVLREMCRRMMKLQNALERRIRRARANCN